MRYCQEITDKFLFYGFTASPLTENEFLRLKREGFTNDDVYRIGCDIYSNQFDCLQEAINYYKGITQND